MKKTDYDGHHWIRRRDHGAACERSRYGRRREAGADAEAGEARGKTFVGAERNNCLKDVKAAEEKAKATHEKAESDIKRMKN